MYEVASSSNDDVCIVSYRTLSFMAKAASVNNNNASYVQFMLVVPTEQHHHLALRKCSRIREKGKAQGNGSLECC